jgi:hypothetical protein
MRQLFAVTPPDYMVLTSTNKLPIAMPDVTRHDITGIRSKIRELEYHPETCLYDHSPDAERWIREKRRMLEDIPLSGSRRQWHAELVAVNRAIQPFVEKPRQRMIAELATAEADFARRTVLDSREFAWCLFPESLVDLLKKRSRSGI